MARRDFHHPFEPYDIQQQFMEEVYECIENSRVGIFESPTGTGKSLSLICASLTWLREHKRRAFQDSLDAIQLDEEDPAWMVEHAREERRREILHLRSDLEARLEAVRKREQKVRERLLNAEPPNKRRKQAGELQGAGDANDEQFVLDDYDSDDESGSTKRNTSHYSSETADLMVKLGMLEDPQHAPDLQEQPEELKIFFCSRTHSQLSQFVGELQRVRLPPGLPPEPDKTEVVEELKHLTLGSRKNLCINPKVSKLANQTAINERCMELQQSTTPADQKCPFLPNKESEDTVLDFRDHALAKIRDIEDIAAVGKKLQICPYYASRPAIGPAEIVTLPYPLLLQKSAREALGISLKDHVVIVDEAHNLIDAVEGIHSTQITSRQLTKARECLMLYLQKFRNRLKGSNRAYVTQLIRVLDSLLQFTLNLDQSATGGIVEPNVLLSGKGADQVNLTKLVRYINDSKLARKVDGYVTQKQYLEAQQSKTSQSRSAPEVPTLTQVQSFLIPLMNPSKEGNFFWTRESDAVTLKYMLLDPSEHFRDVVEETRAVVLAGGTMSPMEDYKQRLFPYVASVQTLSCGHLIPRSSLLVRPISTDVSGPLEFSYKGRSDSKTSARVGNVIESLAPVIKGGLVVFFPSYGYLEQVLAALRDANAFERICSIKPVFSDSREKSADDTFKAYSAAIQSHANGAILLSVIGGKLSEGINFSDELGRCVLVVGLPFPNLETPEWKAKMKYIDQKAVARGEPAGKASREHAENVCMRSVNQAIGRVIRHKGDWASILLMDQRYSQQRISGKLPSWIRGSLPSGVSQQSGSVEHVVEDVADFFSNKKI